jgi:hypothetical protein
MLDDGGLEPRTLGRSDYAVDTPVREALVLARHCAGGLILGFSQVRVSAAVSKPGTSAEEPLDSFVLPTPWNHLEAGLLVAFNHPLLVLCEAGISGGIFGDGALDVFIHRLPTTNGDDETLRLREILRPWQARVWQRYRD